MDKTKEPENSSFLGQIKKMLEDAVNYAKSQLELLQAQFASLALSSVLFIAFIAFASLCGIISFILLSVALGIWLAQILGGAIYSLLIIGGVYALIAIGLGGYAVRWLKNLKS